MKSIFKHGADLLLVLIIILCSIIIAHAQTQSLSNTYFNVTIGSYGEINSLKLAGDAFPTNYVLNGSNSPDQNTSDHQWLGELMFEYRVGSGSYQQATTNASSDVRQITKSGNSVMVQYQNSGNAQGIKSFKLTSTYSLENDYLLWQINVSNPGTQPIEIADFGLPLTFNEKWPGGNEILYETRVLCHSNVAQNSSWMRVTRPSGIGKSLLMIADTATGTGLEYRDIWDTVQHPTSMWAAPKKFSKGLCVYYIHSGRIKSTSRGYLPNTSLTLEPGASKTYSFKFFGVDDESTLKDKLYKEGLADITVIPGMIVPTNLKAKFAIHSKSPISVVEAQFPQQTTITFDKTVSENQYIYTVSFSKLGQNNIVVRYGNNRVTTLQFYVIEPMGDALRRHATFLVEKQMRNAPGQIYDKVFDDWMMETRTSRNIFNGYWGWGDDWGYVKAEYLAQKNVYAPVVKELQAVDQHMEEVIWNRLMKNNHSNYLIYDFLMPEPNTTPTYRGYAYPHIYNTYFSLYQSAKLHSDLYKFINTPQTYLMRAYNILKALYSNGVSYNWETGVMGEQTTPEIIEALQKEGLTTQANDIKTIMGTKYNNFSSTTYPFGSEYVYDNTGEEAVYTLALMNKNTTIMSKINTKTRACRGTMPLWYYYAIPITICGEGRWNGQYTVSLAGYCMNDWMMKHSTTPQLDARLTYAAKIGNIAHVNSGQINSHPDNLGAAAWTYQAGLGINNEYWFRTDWGKLQNGWRQMDGESQLGFWGAIRLLSADVATDPLFGLTGYGCDVTFDANNYTVKPLDGMNRKINLVDIGLTMSLEQDQYSSAVISKNGNSCIFTLKNMKGTAHSVNVTLEGLKAGNYYTFVDNKRTGPVVVTADSKTTFALDIGAVQTSQIEIHTGTSTHIETSLKAPEAIGVMSIKPCSDGIVIDYSGYSKGTSLSIINPAGQVIVRNQQFDRSMHISTETQLLGQGTYVAYINDGVRTLQKRFIIMK